MIKKLLLMLAVSTAASSWLLFAPPVVEDARADTPQWAGWLYAVRTQTNSNPDALLTFTWTTRFTLYSPPATDIAEASFSATYAYRFESYGVNVIVGRYLQQEVTGSGSGSGEGASLWVDYGASTTDPGYYVAVSGGAFPVTTTAVLHFLSDPDSTNTVTADHPTFAIGAFVPSAADDRYMLEGVQVSERCFETECIKEEVSFSLGRVSCIGGPDANGDGITDDDGFNRCRELDRGAAASSPDTDTDTDGDGIPDSTDTDTTGAAPPGTTDGGSQTPGSDECSGFFGCIPWVPILITVVVVAVVVVAAVAVVPGLLAGGAATGGVAAAAEGATLVSAGGAAGGAAVGGAAVAGAADGAGLAMAGVAGTAAVSAGATNAIDYVVTNQAQAAVDHVVTNQAQAPVERHEDRPRPGADRRP